MMTMLLRQSRRLGTQAVFLALALVAGSACAQAVTAADGSPLRDAPRAARHPKDVSVHGDRRIDDFFWLRERERDDVISYLRAEANYTNEWFRPLQGLREQLYAEMLGRIQQDDASVPVREGAYWYASRTEQGRQYPVLTRRAAQGPERALDTAVPEQVLLDLNELAVGRKFLSLGQTQVSPDGRLLAFTLDETGARDFQLQLREIDSGRTLPWRAAKVRSLAWSADGRQLFYVTANAAKRANQLWQHTLDGSEPDRLVYEDGDELYNLQLSTTADRRYVVLSSTAKDSTELRVLAQGHGGAHAGWQLVLPRRRGLEYSLEHHEGRFYLSVNDQGPNYRLITLPSSGLPFDEQRDLPKARQLLAHNESSQIEAMAMFRRHLVLQQREGGSVRLRVFRHDDFKPQEIRFDQAAYVANIGGQLLNREYDSETLRLSFTSMTTPVSIYDYQLDSAALTLRKRQPVLGGFDPAQYVSERRVARARDGTEVPISLVYARMPRVPGPQPLLLRGYGSYGRPNDPRFNANELSLLDRGVIIAIAHVRGGGDLGRRWYQDGKLAKKMNTFTDFIAVAEALIQGGDTSPARLIINGGSAGGLLMGAVTNLRPELFRAVVADVPFVDVINTMLDETLPLTTEEFIEWGNPKKPDEYRWMRAYSPYDNLKRGAYPAILARTGLNDSQVPYWEPAKYVAKLRGLKTDSRPLLFDINMDAGHGGASGRFDALRERAKVYAFMLNEWGLAGTKPR